MKLWVLGSGSKGNAVLVESAGCRVLIDAGFGPRTLAARFRAIGVAPASIEACVVTHEHVDHVRGAAAAAKQWGWALYASGGTVDHSELKTLPVTRFDAGATLSFSRIDVHTVRTPHDATEPVGVVMTARTTGARAAVCTDLGHATADVQDLCRDVDVLVLESNHDEQMLWNGPYPPWLCQRVAGRHGHLSNRDAATLAREAVSKRLHHLVLAHLSEKNNTPDLAVTTMRRALSGAGFRGTLSAAKQDEIVGPFLPRGERMAAAAQYSLAL